MLFHTLCIQEARALAKILLTACWVILHAFSVTITVTTDWIQNKADVSPISAPEVIQLFFILNPQPSTKFILLINVKMPTIVGILTFISMINKHLRNFKQETSLLVSILVL